MPQKRTPLSPSYIEHAQGRAKERYGLTLSKAHLHNMELAIRSGKSVPIQRLSSTRIVHAVQHNNWWLPVIYHKPTGKILTVLPKTNAPFKRFLKSIGRKE